MSLKSDTSDLQINTVADGQVLSTDKAVPLRISAQDTGKNRDVEIEVTLTSPTGDVVSNKRTAVNVNEDIPLMLPADLPAGLYKLDLVLYSSGELVQKKSSSFFVTTEAWKIAGIKSFPPVITTTAMVMLKAELEVPADSDPYLRWSWKRKVIAKGMFSKGLGQILWVAPSAEGVYTITLELFPSPPPDGTDFSFTSSVALSTDIFVSGGRIAGKSDLGPVTSYLSLLRLQASLADAGTGAKKAGRTEAVPIGDPEVVSLESGFGYRLDGSTGIQIPWFALPADAGVLRPFTVSLGVAFDDPGSAGQVLTAQTSSGNMSLDVAMDPAAHAPLARLSGNGVATLEIPWKGPALAAKQRYLISLSIVPQGANVTAQWFLDGTQVSAAVAAWAAPSVKQDGSITIGGEKGFRGTIDEFGVYDRDPQGRPSTDPDLYARMQALAYGSRLVLAEGFDGIFLPTSFALEGSGVLLAGSVDLAEGSGLELPPMAPAGSDVTVTADLSDDSARSAVLQVQWENDSQAPVPYALSADDQGLRFIITADGLSIIVPSGSGEKTLTLPKPPQDGANLLMKIVNPSGATSTLKIDQVLAVKDTQ